MLNTNSEHLLEGWQSRKFSDIFVKHFAKFESIVMLKSQIDTPSPSIKLGLKQISLTVAYKEGLGKVHFKIGAFAPFVVGIHYYLVFNI